MRRSWLPIALALAAACGGAQKPEPAPSSFEASPRPTGAGAANELQLRPRPCKRRQPGNAAVIGRAHDADGEAPLEAVTVVVQSTDGCEYGSTFTDTAGNYTLDELPAGDYCVDFFYSDETVRKLVSIGRGETAMVNAAIAPDGEPPDEQPPCRPWTHGEL